MNRHLPLCSICREEARSDLRFTIFELRGEHQSVRKSYIVNRKLPRLSFAVVVGLFLLLLNFSTFADQRFPPPDFTESGHQLPVTATPPTRQIWFQYLDVAVLAACLGVAIWLIYRHRSRRGVWLLSLFSLLYFGFYRKGCICPIGAPQNIILGLFDYNYTVPITVTAFFVLPLAAALFAGRAFCAAVCPHGVLQDLVLVKPVKIPIWLEHALGVIPFLFLGAGLIFAATGAGFVICRYDPFVPLFRRSGSAFILTIGAAFVLLGLFVGRPYCRFLCPYGALLKIFSLVSKWRVRVTPDYCTQCRLCESSLSLWSDARALVRRGRAENFRCRTAAARLAVGVDAGVNCRWCMARLEAQRSGGECASDRSTC